jgi:hypothetical protein
MARSKSSNSSSSGDALIGGVVVVVIALYFVLLAVGFALTSPGALLAAAWMKLNNVNLPVSTIWMTGGGVAVVIIGFLWAKTRDFAVAATLYIFISCLSVAAEYYIGIRAYAYGESDPPYVRTWLNPYTKSSPLDQLLTALKPATQAVAPPPAQVAVEPPKQKPFVWRDIPPADTSATRQEPGQARSPPIVAVPPVPTISGRRQHD